MRAATAVALSLVFTTAAGAAVAQNAGDGRSADLAPQQDPTTAPTTTPSAAAVNPVVNPVVLRVNGEPIRAFEISMIMQNVQAQLDLRGQEVDTKELAQTATQRAIEQRLLAQEARRLGVEADELDVARAAEAAERRAGGRAILESRLEASGASYEQLLGVIRELELLRAFVEQRIVPNVAVNDEEIAAFYEANPELFETEERVHAFHMIFIAGEDAPEAEQAAARAKAEAARERALTGTEEFSAIARELSEGPAADTGGDLGWINRDTVVKPLSDAVFALEPGAISEVFRSPYGYHVATISERRPAGTIGLEEATDQIGSILRQRKAGETVAQLLDTLIKSARVENVLGSPTPE
jgi:parvulin-like peptidyl-prolyl isomerase